uniref:Secreted protein n=1 Tax=Eutreptiella gymnastica TaxID=73025 RepID=A0A7S4CH20_9EUGL
MLLLFFCVVVVITCKPCAAAGLITVPPPLVTGAPVLFCCATLGAALDRLLEVLTHGCKLLLQVLHRDVACGHLLWNTHAPREGQLGRMKICAEKPASRDNCRFPGTAT